jgi:multiple antibiotic resistance protein
MTAASFGFLCFSSLLTIIDPIAAAPLFVTMTSDASASARRRIAMKACAVALGLLLVFAIGGRLIFGAFGITIEAFRIAGGILFFVMALPMLLGGTKRGDAADEAHEVDPSVVPLGMPIIAGPGAISTVMVLMGQSASAWHVASLVIAVVLVIATTALFLLLAPAIMRVLGRSGVQVITQVMGLIMCVIGIQFILDGLRPVVIEILSSAR